MYIDEESLKSEKESNPMRITFKDWILHLPDKTMMVFSILALLFYVFISYLMSEYTVVGIGNFGMSLLQTDIGNCTWTYLYLILEYVVMGIFLIIRICSLCDSGSFFISLLKEILIVIIIVVAAFYTNDLTTSFVIYERLFPLYGMVQPGWYATKVMLIAPMVTLSPLLLLLIASFALKNVLGEEWCGYIKLCYKIVYWFSVPLSFVMLHAYLVYNGLLESYHVAGLLLLPIVGFSIVPYILYHLPVAE